ncbi:MAG: hypothetical protein NTW28_07400, partial [Candidatus Solibacter sp.]|nr:hypothetical protein [Candidatus Solibacter sp.]
MIAVSIRAAQGAFWNWSLLLCASSASLHCYPQILCYFSQVLCRLGQLRYGGVLRSGYGRNCDASVFGEEV